MSVKVEVSEETKALLRNFKPGQKKETPPPASGTRVFYESLYRERKDSLIALKWCIEFGVLSQEEAEKGLIELEKRKKAKKERMQQLQIQGEKSEKKPKKSKHKHKRQRVEFDDGEFEEGIGTTNL
mmetsp:Transcript_4052/g.4685  ORF Transcript_4052/g.4685 Transcript_4052/m.4685 type:complete len:126 (+) Transcript_4052:197-574(+)